MDLIFLLSNDVVQSWSICLKNSAITSVFRKSMREKFVFVEGDRGGGGSFPGVGEEVFC